MAEKTFFVSKGWIIAKDEFGNMLPFFIHVRDKDIIWDAKDEEFIDQIMKTKDISDIREVAPNKIIKFTSGKWEVEVDYPNKTCTMYTSVDFTSDSLDLNDSRDDLSCNLVLPLTLANNRKLNIQSSLATEYEKVGYSSLSVCKLVEGTTGEIMNVVLHLRNQTYKFPTNFYEVDDYKFSSMYIRITGEFTEY